MRAGPGGADAGGGRTVAVNVWNQRGRFARVHGSVRPRYFGGEAAINYFVNCRWRTWNRSAAYGSGLTDKGGIPVRLKLYDPKYSRRYGWYYEKLRVSSRSGSGSEHWSSCRRDWVGYPHG